MEPVLLSSRKVLVLEDPGGPTTLQVLVLGPQVLENCQELCILQIVQYI